MESELQNILFQKKTRVQLKTKQDLGSFLNEKKCVAGTIMLFDFCRGVSRHAQPFPVPGLQK